MVATVATSPLLYVSRNFFGALHRTDFLSYWHCCSLASKQKKIKRNENRKNRFERFGFGIFSIPFCFCSEENEIEVFSKRLGGKTIAKRQNNKWISFHFKENVQNSKNTAKNEFINNKKYNKNEYLAVFISVFLFLQLDFFPREKIYE